MAPNAKPYLTNALPGSIATNQTFLKDEPINILKAFEERMKTLAQALKAKHGLDIVLLKKDDRPALGIQNQVGKNINGYLVLTELLPKTQQEKGLPILTIEKSKKEFNSILEKAHLWIDLNFPNTVKKPRQINNQEIYTIRQTFKTPEKHSEVVDAVFE